MSCSLPAAAWRDRSAACRDRSGDPRAKSAACRLAPDAWRLASATWRFRAAKLKAKGTANNGDEYAKLSGSVVIPTGAASVKLKMKPIDNNVRDGTRTVLIELSASPTDDYDIRPPKKAVVSILDND